MKSEQDTGFEHADFFKIRNLPVVPKRSKVPLHGGSRRANESDLANYLKEPDESHPTILRDASFLVEGADAESVEGLFKTPFYIPAEIRRRNMLIVGQIGSGKTEELVVPIAVSDIANPTTSVVIVDFKGDLHQKLSPFVKQYRPGSKIRVLNLTNRLRTTHAWNPYSVSNNSETALDDAQSFCAASQTKDQNNDSPFWDGSAARWIAALMYRLREKRGVVCPADVHQALELPRTELLKLLKDGPEVPFASGVASFLESGSQNAETVLATAQLYYRVFQDLELASVTSKNEFTFEQLFKKPTVLILEVSQKDAERVRPLLNLFFLQLFREVATFAECQPGCRLPVPLNVHMDDFAAAMARIPEIGQHLNLARSRDVRILAAIQSLSQIKHFYGSEADSVISGFSSFVFKSPVSLSDAEWASRQSGTSTVETADVVQNYDPTYREGWETVSRTIRLAGRPVLLPEEIRLAPEHFLYGRASTVFLPNAPVFQAWFRPAYDTPGLAEPMAKAMQKRRRRSLRRKPLLWEPSKEPETDIEQRLEKTKEKLDWEKTTGSARKWWNAFEEENQHRLPLVLRLAEELAQRKATITEFFLAYVYSNTDNIQANLHYLDYTRLKKQEEKRKRAN